MENLKFPTGANQGRRPRNEDFIALQELNFASEKVFNHIGAAFIVEGCEITGASPNNDISAGIVFIDGKLRTLPAQTGIDLSSTKYIVAETDLDHDTRPLFSGGAFDSLVAKRAKIAASAAIPPLQSIAMIEGSEGDGFISALFQAPDFTEITTYQGSWVHLGVGFSRSLYRKHKDGFVELFINAKISSTPASYTNVNVFTLPAGFRPASTVEIFANYTNGASTLLTKILSLTSAGMLMASGSGNFNVTTSNFQSLTAYLSFYAAN